MYKNTIPINAQTCMYVVQTVEGCVCVGGGGGVMNKYIGVPDDSLEQMFVWSKPSS